MEDFSLTVSHVIEPSNITEDGQLNSTPEGTRASTLAMVFLGLIDTERTTASYADAIAHQQPIIDRLQYKHMLVMVPGMSRF